MFGLGVFMLFYAFWVFWAPNALGDPVNYVPANPLSTPEHIVPECNLVATRSCAIPDSSAYAGAA